MCQMSAQQEDLCKRGHHYFPKRNKNGIEEQQFGKFMEILKQIDNNIPLVEVTQKMTNYFKFMKYVLTLKEQVGEFGTMALILCPYLSSKSGNEAARPTTIILHLIDISICYPKVKIEDILVRFD